MKKQLYLNVALMILFLLLGTFINIFVLKIIMVIIAAILAYKTFSTLKILLSKSENIDDAEKYKAEALEFKTSTRAEALEFKENTLEECAKKKIDCDREVEKKKNDCDREVEAIKKDIKKLLKDKNNILKEISRLNDDVLVDTCVITIDESITSEEYKSKYNMLILEEKEFVKSGNAVIITANDNTSKKALNNDMKQLLRSFSSESAAAISAITIKNIDSAKSKLTKLFETLNKLFETDCVSLNKKMLEMKLEQADLIYKYQYQKEQERLQQKAIREQMIEEEKVRREIEKEKAKIEKEEAQFKNEVSKLMSYMQKANDVEKQLYIDKIKELESKLKQVEADKENVLQREQNTRAGYVYVISNIGSFGDDVYKIGMTRRLEPMDRVKELGDASVPFEFDVHAMIFSEDAPALETILHNTFKANQVNKVNPRKEFFKVKLDDIEKVVKENFNATVTFTKVAEAAQYRESLKLEKAYATV